MVVVVLGSLYVLALCLAKSFPDDNSVYACVTMLACIGMVCYLRNIVAINVGIMLPIAVVLAFVIQAITGFRQLYHGNGNASFIQGGLANSGAFANYLSAIVPLMLAATIARDGIKRKIRKLAGVLTIAAFVLVLFTQARAAFMGIMTGTACVVFFLSKKKKYRQWLTIFVMGIIIIPLLLFAIYLLKPESAAGRITIYRVSANIIQDHPFTGVGPNRFGAVYNNYQAAYFKNGQQSLSKQLLASNILEAYNVVLQVLTEYGFIGLFLLAGLVYELIKSCIVYQRHHPSNWLYAGSAGCLVSVMVAGFFSNPFHVTPVLLLVTWHLAVIVQPVKHTIVAPAKNYYLSAIVLLVCIMLGYRVIQKHRAERQWQKAAELARLNDFENARHLYSAVYPVLAYNGDFLFNYGAEACVAGDYATAIEQLEKAKRYSSLSNIRVFLADAYAATNQYQLAEVNYLAAVYTTPSHIYPKYKLVRLYKKWGKPALASEWTKRTLQYPVKIPSELSESLIQSLKEGN